MMDVVEAASSLDAHAVLPQEEVEEEAADREEVSLLSTLLLFLLLHPLTSFLLLLSP